MHKFLRTLVQVTGFLAVVGMLLAGTGLGLYLGFSAYSHLKASFAVAWQDHYQPEVFSRIVDSSVSFKSTADEAEGAGSGWQAPMGKGILTTTQVARSLPELPMRGAFEVTVEEKPRQATAYGCLTWVAVCYLATSPGNLTTEDLEQAPGAGATADDEVFILTPSFDRNPRRPLHAGHILARSPLRMTADFGHRRGYSGTPVYNRSGAFVGLLTETESAALNKGIFNLLRLSERRIMRPTSEIIPVSAIKALVPCFQSYSMNTSDCLHAQISLFRSAIDFQMTQSGGDVDQVEASKVLTTLFASDLVSQLANLPEDTEAKDLTLIASVRMLQPGSNEVFAKLRRIRSDTVAELCALLAPVNLGPTPPGSKASAALLAYLDICKEMAKTPSSVTFITQWRDMIRPQLVVAPH